MEPGLAVNRIFDAEGGPFILVSGGGPQGSVNFVAEQTAMEFGLPVISFRPVRLKDYGYDPQYGVKEWRLHKGQGTIIDHEPTFADWQSAANYRSMLIAERASAAEVLQFNKSRGTQFEIELFQAAGKPVNVKEFIIERVER